ncbi:MAG TPA: cell wall-binding repeat-containing protein, partial [Methylomirabilota bacterium]|nr:cell wall-binding repeat-containing protein [Methylomirabilota bacterium]
SAYSLTPTFVDNVPPVVVGRTPASGAVNVAYDGSVTVDFSEPVSGVSGSSVQLRDAANNLVAAAVSYASSTRRATLRPTNALAGDSTYRVSLTSAIKDVAGISLTATSWNFTTGKAVPRLAGADRYATAAAVSRSAFSPGVPVVYIATGSSYPDALAGAPAARAGGGPLLLTAQAFIPGDTAAELTRLKPARIVVLGGSGVVSTTVLNALTSYTTGGVTRIAGADRYATAALISRATFPDGAPAVYVATASTFADALAAGAAAAGAHAPILLVSRYGVPASTLAELTLLDPDTIFVMGGTEAVSDAVVTQLSAAGAVVRRIHGPDRFATAVELSKARFAAGGASTVYVAAGMSFPDGLAAGPVAGTRGAPLLLVPSGSLPGVVADELRRLDPANIVILGGPKAVSDAVRNQIRALWP